jgi:ankyrin repeat protein
MYIQRGILQIVEELASLGSEINASGEGGATSLHMAAQYGHVRTPPVLAASNHPG